MENYYVFLAEALKKENGTKQNNNQENLTQTEAKKEADLEEDLHLGADLEEETIIDDLIIETEAALIIEETAKEALGTEIASKGKINKQF